MYFKNLYLKKAGKRFTRDYLESPIEFNLFSKIVEEVPNINFNSIRNLYYNYSKVLFPEIISKNYSAHSKYFWKFTCLGLTSKSSSLDQYWIERGWPIEDIKDKKKEKFSTNSLQFYLDKGYSKEEANDLYKKRKEMQSKNSLKTKKLTGKYGGYSLDKFIKSGMSESDAKLKLNKIKISKSVSMKKVWDKSESYNERILPQNKEWWINLGYSEEEAVNQVSKIQTTFSLKICIEKYGEIKGREVFDKRQKKWQRSLFEGGNMKVGYSRISQQLFDKIHEKFSDNKVNYATLNKEFIIYNKEKKEVYAYDYVDRTTKRVIEYNGDLFHANPSTYNEYDTPHPYSDITAKDLWDKDRTKLELIKKYGFKVLVVWDSDYRTNPEKEIKKCMNFLLNI